MLAQWPRALIRAALREAGYDAVGTQSLATALRIRPEDPERGAVQVVIVDQPALVASNADSQLSALLTRHRNPVTILVARTTVGSPEGSWTRVMRRPVSVGEIVEAVQALRPLSPDKRHSVD